jgi:hypothetical protein
MGRIQGHRDRGDMAITRHHGPLSLITGLGLIALCRTTHDSLSRIGSFSDDGGSCAPADRDAASAAEGE